MRAPGSGGVGEAEVQTEALSEEVTSQGCRVPSRAVATIGGSESMKLGAILCPKGLLWPAPSGTSATPCCGHI